MINAIIQYLKKKNNTIPITECVKGMQDMKRLQEEKITSQTQKQEQQAQMEPLQEWIAEVLTQAEEAKTKIAQTQAECVELISDKIVVHIVDTLKEKIMQAQTQVVELRENFQAIKEIEEEHKGYERKVVQTPLDLDKTVRSLMA
jgi:hypothetical protein